MFHQAWDVGRHEDAWVVAVETELVILLLYSRMQTPSIPGNT